MNRSLCTFLYKRAEVGEVFRWRCLQSSPVRHRHPMWNELFCLPFWQIYTPRSNTQRKKNLLGATPFLKTAISIRCFFHPCSSVNIHVCGHDSFKSPQRSCDRRNACFVYCFWSRNLKRRCFVRLPILVIHFCIHYRSKEKRVSYRWALLFKRCNL